MTSRPALVERSYWRLRLTKQLVASDLSAASVTKGRTISDNLPQPARFRSPRRGFFLRASARPAPFLMYCVCYMPFNYTLFKYSDRRS